MRKIPDTFTRGTFTYKLLKREGDIVLYEQTSSVGGTLDYEVHKVRYLRADKTKYTNPDGSIRVVERPDREQLAGDGDFGQYGWSFGTLESAEKEFADRVAIEKGIIHSQ